MRLREIADLHRDHSHLDASPVPLHPKNQKGLRHARCPPKSGLTTDIHDATITNFTLYIHYFTRRPGKYRKSHFHSSSGAIGIP